MRSLLVGLGLITLLAACAPAAPPKGQPADYAGTIKRICSPVDATGAELRLHKQAGQGPAIILIQLWGGQTNSVDEAIKLSDPDHVGAMYQCQTIDDCQRVDNSFLLPSAHNSIGPGQGIFWSTEGSIHGSFSVEPVDSGPVICG